MSALYRSGQLNTDQSSLHRSGSKLTDLVNSTLIRALYTLTDLVNSTLVALYTLTDLVNSTLIRTLYTLTDWSQH